MGSLPNLQALSDDPSLPYTYTLQEPHDKPVKSYGPAVAAFNSQHYVDRCRINQQEIEQKLNQLFGQARASVRNKGGKLPKHMRVRQTRSTGSQHPYMVSPALEDYLLEMAATSPPSARSSRSNVMFSINQGVLRRRDSLTSSTGASSVRKLIAVVRSTPSRFGPIYSRRVLCRNMAALCLGHVSITAALMPLLTLQSSVSTWYWGNGEGPGSSLLAASFAVAAAVTLFSPYLVYLLQCNWALVTGYVGMSLFFLGHLYPSLEWLIPSYLLLGLCLGPLACARSTFILTLVNKLMFVLEDEEELQEALHGNMKESLLRRLTRALQVSQDIGMVIGNLVTWQYLQYSWSSSIEDRLRDMFEEERGDVVCGAQACPIDFAHSSPLPGAADNYSSYGDTALFPCRTTGLLASIFVGCALVSVALTAAFTDNIRTSVYQDPLERPVGLTILNAIKCSFFDPRLQLAAPLSVFIGMQQGFIYSDFSKWYVVCSLGVPYVNLVFVSMASLQAVAGFTLSLLMQHVPTMLVIVTGFVFHSCLLLVLMLWKPADDDSALLFVIAAAWGVCNNIWETLSFSTLMHMQPDVTWQAGFAVTYVLRCLGLMLALVFHNIICTRLKLYGLATALILAVSHLSWLQFKIEQRRRKNGITTL